MEIIKSKNYKDGLVRQEVRNFGALDYVDSSGKLVRFAPVQGVMITTDTDLDRLPNVYEAGTLAFTAGFTHLWQLGADGSWTAVE